MQKSLEFSAKNEEEAIAQALNRLNLPREEVSIEIVERAKSGFLGIGSQPAVIRVTFEAPDEPEEVKPKIEQKPIRETKSVREPKPERTEKHAVKERPGAEKSTESAITPVPEETKERIKDFLNGLLPRMGIEAQLDLKVKEDGSVFVELRGEDMGAVIGRRGETLDAIQHLTNYAVNRGSENRRHISIDAENYRSKREESLVRLAEKMAAKALKYKRSMALEPMNSYERHVIHTALQNYDGVSTCSTGAEPNRRVVISCEKDRD